MVNEGADQKEFFAQCASGLAHRFQDTIRPFLAFNGLHLKMRAVETWYQDLSDLFLDALRLEAEAKLLPRAYRYVWPKPGQEVDFPITADTYGLVKEMKGRKARSTVLPALIHTRERPYDRGPTKGSYDQTIFQARVFPHELVYPGEEDDVDLVQ